MKKVVILLMSCLTLACTPVNTKDEAFNRKANTTIQVQNVCDGISASINALAELNREKKLTGRQIAIVDLVIDRTETICTNPTERLYDATALKELVMHNTKLEDMVNENR